MLRITSCARIESRRMFAGWLSGHQCLSSCPTVRRVLWLVVFCLLLSPASRCSAQLEIFNPAWSITLTSHGYADLLFDQRPLFVGREYLSGEWAAAFNYSKGGVPKGTTWLEPHFIAPNWLTNSDFAIVTPIAGTGVFNASGFEVFTSTISNADLSVSMTYQFFDTGIGIEQGMTPKSAFGPGVSKTSNRYILHQAYELVNISGGLLTDVHAFQFLHGLQSTRAVYDDRPYGGPLAAYHYDVSLRGLSVIGSYMHDDILSMHSSRLPTGWEVGRYGIEGIDSHVAGKPSVGVHLSVEADALSGLDLFDMATPPRWVSGAMRWTFPDMPNGAVHRYDVLLSLSTETVPEPSTGVLAGIVLLTTCLRRRRMDNHVHRLF
ncbi:MAG: PEP-CTERM sorting domain-containing protein [Pirellulaceae bacterium]|nr:PEP-CTERM sorting domain-containing protein [Pirellulaceae bacterium]